jgi:hypothetical protein
MREFIKVISVFLMIMFLDGCSSGIQYVSESNIETEPVSTTAVTANVTIVDLGFNRKINPQKRLNDYIPMAVPGDNSIGTSIYDNDGNMPSGIPIISGNITDLFATLYSYQKTEVTYKLLQFVDFAQTPVIVDGKEYTNGFDFTMPADSLIDIPLTVKIQQDGLHEVLLVFVIAADNKSMDEDYRSLKALQHLVVCRVFINVNQTGLSEKTLEYDIPPIIQKSQVIMGAYLAKQKTGLETWFYDYVKPGDSVEGFLHVSSRKMKEKTQYAVILLNEWKQIEIYNGKNVVFLELEPDKEAVIPISLQMPEKEGVYDITSICIQSPYFASKYAPPATSFGRLGIQVSESGKR